MQARFLSCARLECALRFVYVTQEGGSSNASCCFQGEGSFIGERTLFIYIILWVDPTPGEQRCVIVFGTF